MPPRKKGRGRGAAAARTNNADDTSASLAARLVSGTNGPGAMWKLVPGALALHVHALHGSGIDLHGSGIDMSASEPWLQGVLLKLQRMGSPCN